MNITNPIITDYIDTLYDEQSEAIAHLRDYAEREHVPIILKDTEGLLLNLLRLKDAKHVLEIGTAIGYSACCFANGWNGHVTTIEANDEAYELAKKNIKNLGFSERITVLKGDAREVLSHLARSKHPDFDVVFIDAAKSHYREFWDLSMDLVTDNALIICDNVLMKGMTASDVYDPKKKYKTSIGKMRAFLKYICNLDYANTCVVPVGDGVSISLLGKNGNNKA